MQQECWNRLPLDGSGLKELIGRQVVQHVLAGSEGGLQVDEGFERRWQVRAADLDAVRLTEDIPFLVRVPRVDMDGARDEGSRRFVGGGSSLVI